MSERQRQQRARALTDPEYRDAARADCEVGLGFQILAMRKARGWTQQDLATRTGIHQETISKMERLDYQAYTLRTLRRLAQAFDVALFVRFAPFGAIVDYETDLSPDDLAVPGFAHDVRIAALLTDGPAPGRRG